MQSALRKKGLPEIFMKAMMSLYESSKTKVKVGSEFSEDFSVAVNVHKGFALSTLLFAIVVNVVTENGKENLMKEVLYKR